ncbi:MAG: tRNA threonylcarbamoyladenosine dehydratase [Christensenellaceae bacterium]|nr:tRNA threonylcarbamoyladenosine dehydratase [Christensenellaceae bacterium]MEA5064651.1 tRNA threonylcarbamoyladenosine dehydratase [Eubacteriales bacterium]MEA5068223.1 tRNA threonylcarbamoyladenosine dehydratase [Christensenellaceae bacterium]
MMEQFSRNIRLIGEEAQRRLFAARVAVVGLGGVGSYVAEALCRAGVGHLMLADGDAVEESNLNRQLIATRDTLGLAKAEAARARVQSINPACDVDARRVFLDSTTISDFDFTGYDYVCDAIDTVAAKLLLIERAQAQGCPVISAMGAGNKLGVKPFEVADIERTSVCPLARVMRRELKARGLTVKAVYSKEDARKTTDGARTPGSISFVPAMAGLTMAGEVIRAIIG